MTQEFKVTLKALKWFCGLHMTLHDFRGVPLTVFLRSKHKNSYMPVMASSHKWNVGWSDHAVLHQMKDYGCKSTIIFWASNSKFVVNVLQLSELSQSKGKESFGWDPDNGIAFKEAFCLNLI